MFFEIFGKSCNRLDFYRKFQDIPDYAGKSWMVFDALQLWGSSSASLPVSTRGSGFGEFPPCVRPATKKQNPFLILVYGIGHIAVCLYSALIIMKKFYYNFLCPWSLIIMKKHQFINYWADHPQVCLDCTLFLTVDYRYRTLINLYIIWFKNYLSQSEIQCPQQIATASKPIIHSYSLGVATKASVRSLQPWIRTHLH